MGFIFDFNTLKRINKIKKICMDVLEKEFYTKNEHNYIEINSIAFNMEFEDEGISAIVVKVEGRAGRVGYDSVYRGGINHIDGEYGDFEFELELDTEEDAAYEIAKAALMKALLDAHRGEDGE